MSDFSRPVRDSHDLWVFRSTTGNVRNSDSLMGNFQLASLGVCTKLVILSWQMAFGNVRGNSAVSGLRSCVLAINVLFVHLWYFCVIIRINISKHERELSSDSMKRKHIFKHNLVFSTWLFYFFLWQLFAVMLFHPKIIEFVKQKRLKPANVSKNVMNKKIFHHCHTKLFSNSFFTSI